jgi:hypothetical protein
VSEYGLAVPDQSTVGLKAIPVGKTDVRGSYPTPPANLHVSVHCDWPSHCSVPLMIPSPQ